MMHLGGDSKGELTASERSHGLRFNIINSSDSHEELRGETVGNRSDTSQCHS